MAEILVGALAALTRQVVLGLGPLIVLAALLYAVQRLTHRLLGAAIGFRGIAIWTGWLGTPVHELSHAAVGKLFGLDIREVRPFAPDPETGVLGYVRYTRPPLRLSSLHQVIGTFVMGVAPLVGGSLVLWGAWTLLVAPGAGSAYTDAVSRLARVMSEGDAGGVLTGFPALVATLPGTLFHEGAGQVRPWVFAYVALAVGAHLAPSGADLRGGVRGAAVLLVLAYAADAAALSFGAHPAAAAGVLASATAPVTALLVLALILNVLGLAPAALLALVVGRLRRR